MKPRWGSQSSARYQTGEGLVGMTLSLLVLAALILGVIDGARWLSAWSSASEATRFGARLASVCERTEQSAQAIRSQMRVWLPELKLASVSSVIRIVYEDAQSTESGSCDQSNCRQVTVYLQGYGISGIGGLTPSGWLPLPTLRASVAREGLTVRSGACAPT